MRKGEDGSAASPDGALLDPRGSLSVAILPKQLLNYWLISAESWS